jgi:cyclophilin family peptidyl-prolyl cis-trans isomerase
MLIPFLLFAAQAVSASPPTPPPPSDPIEADWRAIPDDELMVMQLAGDRRIVIRLAARFAPVHIANIRALALAHWWDATSVYRVQENWVAQWGDATEKKPVPSGIVPVPPKEFEIADFTPAQTLPRPDAYSLYAGVTADGWPIAGNGQQAWLTHCYGMVGVGRDALPSTGNGAELFTPIGQSARRLDRNYTVVGRIIEGMKYMSALPRSDATMGVYATEAERTGIVSVRLASDMPAAERPHYEYRAADNARFAALIALRERPAPPTVRTGQTVCDVPLATRRSSAHVGS